MKNKTLIISIITILVVSGAAAATWYFLSRNAETPKEPETPAVSPFDPDNQNGYNLGIDCEGADLSKTYEIGGTITCQPSTREYSIVLQEEKDGKLTLKASSYGLFPEREDHSISLSDKVDTFVLEKNKKLVLREQVTDASFEIVINWN